MKKIVTVDPRAKNELGKFNEKVRFQIDSLVFILKTEGRLSFPQGKKIGSKLFEIRIKVGGEYRGLYAYLNKDGIVILHFFQKKTQKTPIESIRLAEKRLKDYEQN